MYNSGGMFMLTLLVWLTLFKMEKKCYFFGSVIFHILAGEALREYIICHLHYRLVSHFPATYIDCFWAYVQLEATQYNIGLRGGGVHKFQATASSLY
jgi:hypothetical protein